MKLLFKQRMFSWLDSYDIFGETGEVIYTVKGKLAWGHCLKIFDGQGQVLGVVKERIFAFLPKFELYLGEQYIGCISRKFTLFRPQYFIDCKGWQVSGDLLEWNYQVLDGEGRMIATVTKEFFHWTDTYMIEVEHAEDALGVLMLVLAIDAEKCSRD